MKWRPEPGEFSVHEIAVHCADAETVDAARIRYLTAERDPVIVGYDESEWARVLDYHSHSLEVALATVEVVCAYTTALLKRLPEIAWAAAVGQHTISGRYTADDWLATESEHIEAHIQQINRNLEAWRASTIEH
jgi:DinB superfamily